MGRGFQVFTNFSGWGPADLMVMKTQGKGKPQIYAIDVKVKTKRSYGGLSDEQRWAGVRVLTVDLVDGHCTLVPEGTERLRQSKRERKENENIQQD